MPTHFYITKEGFDILDIESWFGLRVTSVRGLHPPQPKPLHTRDWAAEHGIDVYIPVDAEGNGNRKRKSSEVTMTFFAEDHDGYMARQKYDDFCDFCFNGLLTYHDTLQGLQVNLLYDANKPEWYNFIGDKKIMFEITFLNPTGEVVKYVAPDTTKPVISLLGNSSVTLAFGAPYSDAGATAIDNKDGNITSSITTSNNVNTSVAGTYVVTYDVSDAAGNAANQVSRTVVVEAEVIIPTIPSVTTVGVTNVSSNYVDITINITSNGNSPVTSKGVYWQLLSEPGGEGGNTSTSYPPNIGVIIFTNRYIGRTNALYRFQAFATNTVGTTYGEWIEFTTMP